VNKGGCDNPQNNAQAGLGMALAVTGFTMLASPILQFVHFEVFGFNQRFLD